MSTQFIDSKHRNSARQLIDALGVAKSNQEGGSQGGVYGNPRRISFGFGFTYLTQALLTSIPLLAADLTALGLVVWLTSTVFFAHDPAWSSLFGFALFGWTAILAQPLIGAATGLYPGVGLSPASELRLTSIASSLWVALLLCMLTFHQTAGMAWSLLPLAFTWLLAIAAVPFARSLARKYASRYQWWGQPAVILGGGPDAAMVYRSLQAHQEIGLRPLGVIDDINAHRKDRFIEPSWFLGPPSAARRIVDQYGVFWGIVPVESRSFSGVAELLDNCSMILPHLLLLGEGAIGHRDWNGARDCGGLASLRIDERLLLPNAQIAKRFMDIMFSFAGILFLAPLISLIIIAIKRSSPGPVFYGQQRIGVNGRKFRAWKFRSMMTNADVVLKEYLSNDPELRAEWERDHKLKNDPRVTSIGRFLRKTSLDELPQLWNVLIGEMSLVGPRPIVEEETVKYGESYPLYRRVRPGITGLWQVSGRNNTTYEERVRFDTTYARNWSLWLDLYLLARTVRVVLLREGAY